RFEGQHPTEATDYCLNHSVCLCKKQYSSESPISAHMCQQGDWTCWQKFHDFYLPRQRFNKPGRICRGSKNFKVHKTYVQE
ncbi:TPA: hypothetical protein N0F65_012171, partial [Lagenidium giganteum]